MRDIQYIVVHCSDSPQGRGDTAETLHRWHKQRGWDGIGYSAVILESGEIENGRPDYWIPSHVKGLNGVSIGVCLIGKGGDATENQLTALREYLTRKHQQYPDAEILGHCDLDSGKSCPGFDVREWWQKVNSEDF